MIKSCNERDTDLIIHNWRKIVPGFLLELKDCNCLGVLASATFPLEVGYSWQASEPCALHTYWNRSLPDGLTCWKHSTSSTSTMNSCKKKCKDIQQKYLPGAHSFFPTHGYRSFEHKTHLG